MITRTTRCGWLCLPARASRSRPCSSALFWLIFGLPTAYPLFAGFLIGYLIYDYMHYYLHHFVPRSDLGKRLREQHMRHHFQDHRYGYGVSSPLWDVVFRTLPRTRRNLIDGRPAPLTRLSLKLQGDRCPPRSLVVEGTNRYPSFTYDDCVTRWEFERGL